jgi:hypothetical protein
VVVVEVVLVAVLGTGVRVDVVTLVDVIVVVVKSVVDVTMVEVEAALTMMGSCVIVTIAKKPALSG